MKHEELIIEKQCRFTTMTDERLLENALDYIYELVEQEDWICCALVAIPEELEICHETCNNLCKDCIKRYLKHYKKEEQ